MFVRFRQTKYRLQVSLAETRRVGGKVCHEHIASLGSVDDPQSVQGRIVFWQRLHERLAKLSNRVDAAMQGKIFGDVHARIPMVTLDEQHALKLQNAESDERFWAGIRDMKQGTAEDHKALAATADRAIAEGQAEAAKAGAKAADAKERGARIRKGEDVPGGLGAPLTQKDLIRILREAGATASDIRHIGRVGAIDKLGEYEELRKEYKKQFERSIRAPRAASRAVLRRLRAGGGGPD